MAVATKVVTLVDRLRDNEMHLQHRLHQMWATLSKVLSRTPATRAWYQKLWMADPRTDATLVVMRIDMRLVLAMTAEQCP